MERPRPKINWTMVLVFLLLLGGLIGITVYLAEVILHVTLALTLLFLLTGGIAYWFFLRGEGRAWRFVAALIWPGAVIALTVFLIEEQGLHPALAISMLFFVSAGILVYVLNQKQDADARALNARVRWEKLGQRRDGHGEPSPSERDVPMERGYR
jgi:hypothetical protein